MCPSKREYFANIKINNIADRKKFRQAVKPLFSDKINHREAVNLIDNGVALSNGEEIAGTFNFFSLNETLYRVNKLNPKKASQATDILVKIIKEKKDAVSFYVFHNFSNALSSYSFPTSLKYADIQLTFKKDDKLIKKIIVPLVSF